MRYKKIALNLDSEHLISHNFFFLSMVFFLFEYLSREMKEGIALCVCVCARVCESSELKLDNS